MNAHIRALVVAAVIGAAGVVGGVVVARADEARADAPAEKAQGGPVIEGDESTAAPIYVRSPWLKALPLLCLLVVVWNVDWREARVKREVADARAARAPKVKGP